MALCNAQTSTLSHLAVVAIVIVAGTSLAASAAFGAEVVANSTQLFGSAATASTLPAPTIGRATGEQLNDGTNHSSHALRSFGSFAGQLFTHRTSNSEQDQKQKQQQQRERQKSNNSSTDDDDDDGATSAQRTSADRTIAELLAKLGPDMRPSGEYRDLRGVTVDIAQRAWRRMHKHAAEVVADKVGQTWPMIESALLDANVSSGCSLAAKKTAAGARNLDAWAIQRE